MDWVGVEPTTSATAYSRLLFTSYLNGQLWK
jgi:hypothetical protein